MPNEFRVYMGPLVLFALMLPFLGMPAHGVWAIQGCE
jgi:hypothetical protein